MVSARDLPPAKDAGLFGASLDLERDEIVIIGVPWEPTVSFGQGASHTPAAIIPASHQLDFFDLRIQGSFGDAVGMLPLNEEWWRISQHCRRLAEPIIEAGPDLNREHRASLEEILAASKRLNQELYAQTLELLAENKTVAVLGGDHSSPLGCMRAYMERRPGASILHIDAHHDLRAAYEGFVYSHASIMYNLLEEVPETGALVSVGIRDFCEEEFQYARTHPKITSFYDRDLKRALASGRSWSSICQDIVPTLGREVYVSCDIDGLDPRFCPNTGTPVPGGLDYDQLCFLLDSVVESGRRIVGFDLCEVAPALPPLVSDWNLNLGARILFQLCVAAHLSKKNNQKMA